MTTVDGRQAKPLQSGSRLAIVGMFAVLLGLMLDPASNLGWVVNAGGAAVATWGSVQALTGLARLRGRRSLTEAAVGSGLTGAAATLAAVVAHAPVGRENEWTFGIAAIGFATLGIPLLIAGAVDHRKEQELMDNPPEPSPDAISKPQHPGYPLRAQESQLLRLTLAVALACYVAVTALAFLR